MSATAILKRICAYETQSVSIHDILIAMHYRVILNTHLEENHLQRSKGWIDFFSCAFLSFWSSFFLVLNVFKEKIFLAFVAAVQRTYYLFLFFVGENEII